MHVLRNLKGATELASVGFKSLIRESWRNRVFLRMLVNLGKLEEVSHRWSFCLRLGLLLSLMQIMLDGSSVISSSMEGSGKCVKKVASTDY